MRQIRRGVFETNSSSTHSITMCSGDDFDKWKSGQLLYCGDVWGSESEYARLTFVTEEQAKDILEKCKYYKAIYNKIPTDKLSREELLEACEEADIEIKDYDGYWDDYLECYINEFTTPGGERVVAFGEFG